MLIAKSAGELHAMLARGEVSAVEISTAFLDHAESFDEKTAAFLRLDREKVLDQAKAVDAKRSRGAKLGLMAGIPVGIKDILCERGELTTCGSRILERYRPPYNAYAIERLRSEDAILFGRLNMDEFAMGSSTENSAYKRTKNPWNLACVPGGSSGGSSAAVAARMVPTALGTDTGGSIRQPASCTGITGLKPTYGRVSRYGLVAFASSLDQIGPMTHDVEDSARLLQAIAGYDKRDSTSVNIPVPDYLAAVLKPLDGLRVGVPKEYFGEGLRAEVEGPVREAIKVFAKGGAKITEVSLPYSGVSLAVYYLVATAEASSNLARYDGTHYGSFAKNPTNLEDLVSRSRGEGFGKEVKRRILLGAFALSAGYRDAYYVRALKVRRLIKNDFDRVFKDVDVVVGPTAPTVAFCLGEKCTDPMAMYLTDVYTVGANLAGLPGVSAPCGFSPKGMPVGLQIQAPAFHEESLFQAAGFYQRETDWHRRLPRLVQESMGGRS
jgi:aspartyl-tRNA(Asn)/glutamyl-tRNA(Gln) amidotransferase subunit A